MKTEHTLRYLLLRHLEPFAEAVPRERYLEVSRSLRVEALGRRAYRVSYRDGGREQTMELPFDAFRFYERGDTRSDERAADDDLANPNEERARRFAEQVFGLRADSLPTPAAEPLEGYPRAAIAEMTVFALAVAWTAELDAIAALALLALALAEFAPRGRLVCSGVICIVALSSPASAALLVASAYALLQWLDPDPSQRTARTALCALAAGVAAARLATGADGSEWGLAAVGVLLLATGIAALRSLYGSHFRALSLALPFYCAGLVADEHGVAAALGLGLLALSAAFAAVVHRFLPVQRARG